ncbi:hypothetical protein Tco_0895687 [Tanacetum coccineum]|uniref:Uncharacterized protein n=1 Tax=Tanacetum coccineum TaxID=301880 RepID=A0ABQ5CFA8_9ASTR
MKSMLYPGLPDTQTLELSLPTMLHIKQMIWMPMYSECDELNLSQDCSQANLSRNAQNALTEEQAFVCSNPHVPSVSDETLMLCEEIRSKMLLKEQDPMVVKHKVNTKPINYAVLNNDYNKRFVRQSDLYSEHAYWKATSVPALDPSPSFITIKVEVPKELPKVSMVNTSLKELKRHLAGFDQVVKERTTATTITRGV